MMEGYQNKVADCESGYDASQANGRTVIVTGGANGLGEQYVRDIVKAGGYVAFGDVDEKCGKALADEFPERTRFVKCDVTSWTDQVKLFSEALALSPEKKIDVVIANAGIGPLDSVFTTDVEKEQPEEPALKGFKVNGTGTMYTVHLALHHFRRQHAQGKTTDKVLMLGGSLAGYLDIQGSMEYGGSKQMARAIMRNLRLSEYKNNIRVVYIAPWFVATKILAPEIVGYLKSQGAEFATVEDASSAIMKVICDSTVNGRTFAILPRSLAPSGYLDIDSDDPPEGTTLNKLQKAFNASMNINTVPKVATS